MRFVLLVISSLLVIGATAQDVILFEDFEGAVPGWSKSTPHTNEWYVLSLNSSFISRKIMKH